MINKNRKKVAIAMSGGVDSSVSAALLKKQGYDVIGVHFKLWKDKLDNSSKKNAREVAKFLGIPFYVLDIKKEFKKLIVDYFLSEYKKGRTPNPCIKCNQTIKFGKFYNQAKKRWKVDYIATGHYLKISEIKDKYKIFKAKDANKDQSYFLYNLNQNILSYCIFPIADYTKDEVKEIAKKMKLPIGQNKESQEICFISDKYIDNFLKKYLKLKKGDIKDANGHLLGGHDGLPLYTIGQRRNIKLSGGPWYVVGMDFKKNNLIVSNKIEDASMMNGEFMVEKTNWISGNLPALPLKCKIRTRYRQEEISGKIFKTSQTRKFKIVLNKKCRAIMPGQSAVFYKGNEVLGGGIISKIIK